MPTITIARDLLFRAMGKTYTEHEFDELCFAFGIELDDVVEDAGKTMYKIDVPANRYDILCLEGLSRALKVFLTMEKAPVFAALPDVLSVNVEASTLGVRPYVVCAVLRGVSFTPDSYQSFLDLQDHLHRNICRRRTLVAIGTHDLSTLTFPVVYRAVAPDALKFRHLFAAENSEPQTLRQVLDEFRSDPERSHLREYTDIIYDKPLWPVLQDQKGVVLSLPPIINGAHSKMSVSTRDVFVECTATDLTKAKVVLDIMVTMFARYCAKPDTVERVKVTFPHGVDTTESQEKLYSMVTPVLGDRDFTLPVADAHQILGLRLDPESIAALLDKMQHKSEVKSDEEILVKVPPMRADVLHAVDLVEDVAIAYGFNLIPENDPPSHNPGKELALNQMSDLLRCELANAGFMEILTFGLCSRESAYAHLQREDDGTEAVALANPKTIEYQIARPSLIPGLLKTLQEHKGEQMSNGLRLFEVSDVLLLDSTAETRARNSRRVAIMYSGPSDGLEVCHGALDRIMQLLNVQPSPQYSADGAAEAERLRGKNAVLAGTYVIEAYGSASPLSRNSGASPATYFPGKGGLVAWTNAAGKTVELGTLGALHPRVVKTHGLHYPVSCLELTIDAFAEIA